MIRATRAIVLETRIIAVVWNQGISFILAAIVAISVPYTSPREHEKQITVFIDLRNIIKERGGMADLPAP